MEVVYKRYCKMCEELKDISEYGKTTNKRSKTITYRHICKGCNKNKRKNYYKKYYIRKKLGVDSDETVLSQSDETTIL